MLFHYGDCKTAIDNLNKEIDLLRSRKKEAEHTTELHKGELDKLKKVYQDALIKVKTLEDNFEKSLAFKAQEYHEKINTALDEKQSALAKLAKLEAAYTNLGIQTGELRNLLESTQAELDYAKANDKYGREVGGQKYKEQCAEIEKLEAINAEWARQVEELKETHLLKSQIIYHAIMMISARQQSIDIVNLQDELDKMGKLEFVGGIVYLLGLQEYTPEYRDSKEKSGNGTKRRKPNNSRQVSA